MPGKIEWIKYKSKEILFNDRSGLKGEEVIKNIDQSVSLIKKSGKTDVLYMIDNTNNIVTPEIRDYIKKAGKELEPFVKKTAILGTNRAQQVMMNIYANVTSMSLKAFDDIDRAKEWLIK